MVSEEIKEIAGYFIQGAILLIIMILFSQSLGLFGTGFDSEEILEQFGFYSGPGIGFLVTIILLHIAVKLLKFRITKYDDSLAFADLGKKPGLSIFKKFTSIQILILSILIFSVLAMVAFNVKQESFTGIKLLEQQFSPTSSVLFSSLLIPAAENLGLAVVIAFSLFLLLVIAKKLNLSIYNWWFLCYIIIIPLGGLFGYMWHTLRYSGMDVNMITVIVFWSFGAFITLLIGSFIPFWVLHVINNLFIDLGRFFSNENVYIGIIIFDIILIGIYIVVYRNKLLGNKTKNV